MLNVSTVFPTTAPRGMPAPARAGSGDFLDTLKALIAAPAVDTPLVVPAAGTATTTLCAVAPAGPAALPDTAPFAAALADTLPAVAPADADGAAEPDATVPLFPALPSKRQRIADDGKTLPAPVPDEDDPGRDVIWLPTAPVPPVPVARPPSLPAGGAATVPAAPPSGGGTFARPAPAAAQDGAQDGARSGDAIAPSRPSPDMAPAAAGVTADGGAPAAPVDDAPALPVTGPTRAEPPMRVDGTAAAVAPPAQPSRLPPAPVLPASQAFAAAIAAAVRQGRDEREAAEPHAPIAIATAALERLHAPAVAAPPDARQTALDLGQNSGLQGMIDHIEVLRDGANAGDTRIRLVPDALGAVDVSVRREGDRLHVHFNAETQASARLISDAQPRLAELADARGVKLGETSVDTGDHPSRQQQQPATPTQFTRPVAAAGDLTDTPDDVRVA